MVQVGLSDDVCPAEDRVTVALHDDCGASSCCCGSSTEEPPVLDVWTIRQRSRTGWSEDGNPVFEWTDLLSGEAVSVVTSTEWDPDAGSQVDVATLVLAAGDVADIPLTAVAVDAAGGMWRITEARVAAGVGTMKLQSVKYG